jgi:hypothetical protein
MGGSDNHAKQNSYYSMAVQYYRRSWLLLFYFLLDAAVTNSYILFRTGAKDKKSSPMLNFKRKSHEVYSADPALFYGNDHHVLPKLAAIPTLKQCEKQRTKGADGAN